MYKVRGAPLGGLRMTTPTPVSTYFSALIVYKFNLDRKKYTHARTHTHICIGRPKG